MRIYICGPMTGIPLFNFPTFDDARDTLNDECHEAVSPADLDREHGFDPANLPDDYDWFTIPESAGTREEIIKRDTEAIMSCQGIYLLPGWSNSVGAKAEAALARWAGLRIFDGDPNFTFESVFDYSHPKTQPTVDAVKDGNPKDNVGCKKPGLSAVPCAPLYEAGAALTYGGNKYGKHNWRGIGVRASVYYDAALRHLMAWWEGEDIDPIEHGGSGLPHLAHAIAGLMVYRDCEIAGLTTDDRPIRIGNPSLRLNEVMAEIAERYPNPVAPYTEAANHG